MAPSAPNAGGACASRRRGPPATARRSPAPGGLRPALCALLSWAALLAAGGEALGTTPDARRSPRGGGREPALASSAQGSGEKRPSDAGAAGRNRRAGAEPPAASSKPGEARNWQREADAGPARYYLALPRALLLPPRLLWQGLSYPLRATARFVEDERVVEHVTDWLYNDARTAAVLPAAHFQTDYGLSLGARAFHSDVFGNRERLGGSALYGGLFNQGYELTFEGERVAHTPLWLELDARWEAKPALFFQGYGDSANRNSGEGNQSPRATSVATRFSEERALIASTVGVINRLRGAQARFGLSTSFNQRTFAGKRGDAPEPSIEEAYDVSRVAGFSRGADILEVSATVSFDSRDSEGLSAGGAYFDAFAGHTLPVSEHVDYFHYGVTAAAFFDLFRGSRILSLRGVLEGVLGPAEDIPFTELVRLGGADRLRGYRLDRFRDEVAAVVTAEYRYAVHQYIAGEVFLDAGRVSESHSALFDPGNPRPVRFGAGLGLVFHDERNQLFKVSAAYGEDLYFFFSTDPLAAFGRRHRRL